MIVGRYSREMRKRGAYKAAAVNVNTIFSSYKYEFDTCLSFMYLEALYDMLNLYSFNSI